MWAPINQDAIPSGVFGKYFRIKQNFPGQESADWALSSSTFNASNSSSIYKDSANVVPTSRKTIFIIKY